MDTTADVKPTPVLVGFAPPQMQRRASVGFRIVLLVPHFVFGWLLSIASQVVVVISWFAALFTGRVPEGLFEFLAGTLRYSARVNAYIWLLTDKYPPFDLDRADYPISVEVAPTKLNRGAVLFRIILMIPALIVVTLVGLGLYIAGFFIWLIVLITGRMPRTLFEAVAASVRYQTRFTAYLMLLTPAYPGGLFGDQPAAVVGPPSEFAPPSPVDDALWATTEASPPPPAPLPPAPPPPPFEAPISAFAPPPPIAMGADAPAPPLATKLVLSKSGKRVVRLFLLLGVLSYGGLIAIGIVTDVTRTVAVDTMNRDYSALRDAVATFEEKTAACGAAPQIDCLQNADLALSSALSTFADQVHHVTFPAQAKAAAAKVEADARAVAAQLQRLVSAPTLAAYETLVPELQRRSNQFDTDYNALAAVI